MIFRIDDVTSNTDMIELKKIIKYIKDSYMADVWSCVTPLSQTNIDGSVYPNPPFKHMDREKFYSVNSYFDGVRVGLSNTRIVSHGLLHVDHSSFQFDAQEMSIVSSCKLLDTEIFVPPFNKFNQATEAICRQHKILLVKSYDEGWRSLEHEPFDPNHKLWYFHPWKFTLEEFKHALAPSRANVSA